VSESFVTNKRHKFILVEPLHSLAKPPDLERKQAAKYLATVRQSDRKRRYRQNFNLT